MNTKSTIHPITWLGLLIAYASVSVINYIFKNIGGPMLDDPLALTREVIIFLAVASLLLIIVKGEKLGLDSIGLSFDRWGRSLGLALLIMIISFVVIVGSVLLCQWIGWSFGESKAFDNLSLWTVTLITIRAGVSEEIFMRGYLLERLATLTGNKWVAGALSLIPFALLHYTGQGWAGVLVSFSAGAVLTVFYFYKRDLKANIIAHFLVDFIANVPPNWF